MGRVGALWLWLILAAALVLGAVAAPRVGAQASTPQPPPPGCVPPPGRYWAWAGEWVFDLQGEYAMSTHYPPASTFVAPAAYTQLCYTLTNWEYGPPSAYQYQEYLTDGPLAPPDNNWRWLPTADGIVRDNWPGAAGEVPVYIRLSWYNPYARGTLRVWVALEGLPTATPEPPTPTSGGGGSGGGSGGGGGGSGGGGGGGGATPTAPVPGWCGMVPSDPCYVEWISWRTAVAELRATDTAGGGGGDSLPQPPLLTAAAGAATVAAVVAQPTPTAYGANERATAEAALTAGPVAPGYSAAGPGPVAFDDQVLSIVTERYDFGCPIAYPPWGLAICISYVYIRDIRIGPVEIPLDTVVGAALILFCIGFIVRR